MLRKIFFLLMFITGINQTFFSQSMQKKVYHPFTGTLVVTMEGGATYGLTDYKDFSLDFLGRGMIEYFLPTYSKSSFGLRAFGGAGYLKGKDKSAVSPYPVEFRTELKLAGGGIVYALSLGEAVFPYVFAGATYTWFSPKGDNGTALTNNANNVYKKNELDYNAEFGMRILLTDNLTMNFSGGIQLSPNDYLDDKLYGTSKDAVLVGTMGFSFAFFGEHDSDEDGIVDSKDLCPNAPKGIKVDQFGCPIDTDKDGVPDYLDECPDTPEKVKVDKKGCPLDTDNDGIPDYIDICSNTPKGVLVDEFGCPLDADNDGIPDYLDKCSNTPTGVQVDKYGCPLDSDGDGVPDYLDKCPNTPKNEQVDEFGCPLKKQEIIKEVPVVKEIVLSAETSFGVGSSVLLPGAYGDLDKIVQTMMEESRLVGTKWLVEGHTDNTGSAANNKKLSLKRANAVVNYLVSKGISKNRFTIRGMGPDYPVADNRTEEGRAKNRRVVILRVD